MSLLKLPTEVTEALGRLDKLEQDMTAIRVAVERLVEIEEAKQQ